MIWRVEIKQKAGVFDAAGASIQKDIVDLGVNSVHRVEVIQIYNIEGSISEEQVTRVCRELFVDGITQEYACCKLNEWRAADLKAAGGRSPLRPIGSLREGPNGQREPNGKHDFTQ